MVVSSFGQDKLPKRTLISVGLAVPTDDFADTKIGSIRSGFAGTGVSVGITQYLPTKKEYLSLMYGLDLTANPYSKDAKEVIEDASGNIEDIRFPIYFNVPIRGGLEYRVTPSEDIELFGNAGLSFNLQKRTSFVKTWVNYDYDRVSTFSFSSGFGGFVGVGMLVGGKNTFGIDYYNLGKHRMKASWTEGSQSGTYTPEKFNITLVKVYAAFPFGK